MQLPIDSIKANFLEAVKSNHVLVSAATGTGKSTQLPLWCKHAGRVLVIEPRRIACVSLAHYVAAQVECELGQEVGYSIRFENHTSDLTKIVFATPGVALRWFMEDNLNAFDVVIIDEFHERRWDTDLLLAMLKQSNSHRIVITSATLHASAIANYLECELLTAAGKQFDVACKYIASNKRDMPSKENLSDRVQQACEYALAACNDDILVFLPGKGEIQQAASQLKELDCEVVQLHGGSTITQQSAALNIANRRRIVLATNVAETSLTIPGIDCVIDSGLERRTHLRNGRSVLALSAISNDSKLQRRGRAGRVKPGLCIALYGETAPLITHTPPETQRENLIEMVLACAASDFNISELEFIERLPESALKKAIETLKSICAIDEQHRATEYGKSLYALPLDAPLAHLVNCDTSSATKQAIIDLVSIVAVPAKVYTVDQSIETQTELEKIVKHRCDIELAIATLRGQLSEIVTTEPNALNEALQFSSNLRDQQQLPNIKQFANYDYSALIAALVNQLPSQVYINKQNRRGSFGNGYDEVVLSKDSRVSDDVDAIFVLKTHTLAGRGIKDAKTLATVAAPLNLSQLLQTNIATRTLTNVILKDEQLLGEYQMQYAGISLSTQINTLTADDLNQALVMAIKAQLIFPELYNKLQHQFATYSLFNEVNQTDLTIREPELHLTQLICDLELCEFEDIQLFDDTDFYYVGTPDDELAQFAENYPLTIQLPQQKLRCEYFIRAKKVVLHYLEGQRKDAPNRWQLPKFSGYKIQYLKASKRVDIK